MTNRTALITGASHGLGRALAAALAENGDWHLIITARGAEDLDAAAERFGRQRVTALPGDVTDSWHRTALLDAIERTGGLDLLVNNASTLGRTPLSTLAEYPISDLEAAFQVNTFAPLSIIQGALPHLRARRGAILNISSDAAVEAYETWGGYGATKAALDQISNVLAVEEPEVAVWSVDPGEMRTRMLQEAMPGDDLSDTPPPESVVPALLNLINDRRPSGRYRAARDQGPSLVTA